jgi:N6-adenosine-specific RNA methylase IME4
MTRGKALVVAEPPGALLGVEQARQFLAKSKSVDEVRNVADKAAAVALYLRSRNASIESQNDAAEIRMRAERRLGQLTAELDKHPGGRPGKTRDNASPVLSLRELGIDKDKSKKWQALAAVPDKKFESYVETTRAKGERITSSAPLKLAKFEDKAKLAARLRAKPVPMPLGRFDVIASDPPWLYKKHAGDVTQRGATPYPGMELEEICALPVAERCEENCILWLWTTNGFMRQAYTVLDAWGFEERTILTWVKDKMGTGDWLRGKTEHCILAIRGKPTIQLTNQTTELRGAVREHSRKPEEFYGLVDRLCPGSKLEMFSQTPREGWAAWGAQTNKFAA